MKKIILIITVLALVIGTIWYIKNDKISIDENIKTYTNSSLGISFDYPKTLTVSATGEMITLHHEVPFTHHDYCDFKGEIDTTINTLTDFNVSFRVQNKGLVDTMKSFSPYIPPENFVNNTVVVSPGFIDSYSVGKLKGYKIFEGAEGCGQTTYYFPISNSKTLIVQEELITVFTGAIDIENMDKALAVPGVINKEKSTEIFESVLKTLKI
ncbi:MAG: hypothetical protein NTX96_02365 [Candidatus Zambryskibacteria bacterium]|nr:hypothetical protein [Candidatus Zambryskibacteria bacterium]